MNLYQNILRPIFFKINPETIHNLALLELKLASNFNISEKILSKKTNYTNPVLQQNIWELDFPNPIGLAAGFDKNAQAIKVYPMLNFGWAEMGSVTAEIQTGNPKPRLFRIPEKKSIIVYYGLANDGVLKIAERIKKFKQKNKNYVLGASIAKTTKVPDHKTIEDYVKTFDALYDITSYITINVSCPNVDYFKNKLYQSKFINELLSAIQESRLKKEIKKPLLIKIGPDNSSHELEKIIDVAVDNKIDAIIATNLTKNRSKLNLDSKYKKLSGGVSGKLLQNLADKNIAHIYKYAGDKIKIIGCGGIFTAEDAYQKIKLGASLLQLITGMIYNGPLAIKSINLGLAKLLEKDGFKNIEEAVGIENNF